MVGAIRVSLYGLARPLLFVSLDKSMKPRLMSLEAVTEYWFCMYSFIKNEFRDIFFLKDYLRSPNPGSLSYVEIILGLERYFGSYYFK